MKKIYLFFYLKTNVNSIIELKVVYSTQLLIRIFFIIWFFKIKQLIFTNLYIFLHINKNKSTVIPINFSIKGNKWILLLITRAKIMCIKNP